MNAVLVGRNMISKKIWSVGRKPMNDGIKLGSLKDR